MKKILEEYKAGKIPLTEVLKKLEELPYKDLGFAKIDTHRLIRKGHPETIFCQGKTVPQILSIIKAVKQLVKPTSAQDKRQIGFLRNER